jgi:hypothetical protein
MTQNTESPDTPGGFRREFESLRARRSEGVHALGPSLWVSMGLEFSSDRR